MNDKIDENALNEKVLSELRGIGIIDEHKVIYKNFDSLGNHFPVFTNKFVEDSQKLYNLTKETFENVMVIGKGTGRNFLMNDVLLDVYEQIQNKFFK